MSRKRLYDYNVYLPHATWLEWDAYLDALCAAVEKRWPRCFWNGGGGCYQAARGPLVQYAVYANKTKAKRLAAALDDELGITGELVEWVDR